MAGKGKRDESRDDLLPKEEQLVKEYFECNDIVEAYRKTYNCEGLSDNQVTNLAHKSFGKPRVKSRIEFFSKRATVQAMKKYELSREWIIERLMRNAMYALGELDREIITKNPKTGEISVRSVNERDVSGANKALELLGKVDAIGLFEERINTSGEIFVIAAPTDDEDKDVETWAEAHRNMET